MRVECESCRGLVAASFRITGDAIHATCPVCHHQMMASPPAPVPALDAPPAGEPGDPAAICPKCSAPRTGAEACASCGLSVARMAAYHDARDAAVPEAVCEAWRRATEGWTDAARHDDLLRLAAAHDCYAWAAGRYRTRRDDVAVRQLERLRRAAEATLLASATVRPDASTRPYRASRAVLMILIVAVLVGVAYTMVVSGRGPAPRAPAVPVRPLVPGHPVSPSTIPK